MNLSLRTLLLTTAAGVAAAMPAQEPEARTQQPPAVQAPAPTKTVPQLIEALGSESYRDRLDAERALRARGNDAVDALKQAAENSDDPEVQLRARRVLRQIEQGGTGTLQKKPRTGAAPRVDEAPPETDRGAMRDQFESLFERFERDFGIDVPRARFFGDRFFRDLQQQMQQGNSRSQGMSMQIGPDGVRVEVQEKGADGKAETKVYEAPDLETFQKQYPDVLRENGLGMGLQLPGRAFFGQPLRGFRIEQDQGDPQVWTFPPARGGQLPHVDIAPSATPPPAPAPAGKRLGVAIEREIPAAVRAYLELDDGVGLLIQSVEDDSLAAALGLEKGDIVTGIAGTPIGTPQDVQKALAPIKKGEKVEVQFVRKGATKTASADKTEDVAAEAEAPRTERLQRRSKGDSSIR
jgi:hypothetical protein